jgi:hypothetical protein
LEKSPVPLALSANALSGGQTQILNVRRIKRIDHYPAESTEECSPESISDTEHWLNWITVLDNPNESENNWEADNESHMEMDNHSENSECMEQCNESASLNVPRLIRPIRRSKTKFQKVLMMVKIMQWKTNKGIKKKYNRIRQCIITKFNM